MAFSIKIDTSILEKKFRDAAAALSRPIAAGVKVKGKAADHAFVLEFGSQRGAKPWPNAREKTTTGPGGRIFSKQAPRGYVRVFADKFLIFLRDELRKRLKPEELPNEQTLREAADAAATDALGVIRAAVPVGGGSGQRTASRTPHLRDSLVVERSK